MKLLYLADIRFPMERANGIQTVETAHALARAGAEVELVVRRSDGRSDAACLAFFGLDEHPGLSLHRVTTPFGRTSFLLASLARMLSSTADIIYTRDLVLGDLASRLGRAPVVYEAHTAASVFAEESAGMYADRSAPSPAKLRRLEARERRVCRQARGVVSITRALDGVLHERHGPIAASAVIPDGCRLPESPQPSFEPHVPARVVYIGQLYPWKGVEVLVEAVARLEDAELVIVGGLPPEPDLDRVKALSARLGISHRTSFRGFVPPPELAAERESADIFVIPLLDSTTARLFTSPLKLFEAMAAGRPIIASDLPSIREILTHEENALLVPPGDPEALARAILRLLGDGELAGRLSTRAFDDVSAYSWDRRAERLLEFLEQQPS